MMRPRRSQPADGGYSLVELVVAMGVLAVVLVIVTNLFVTVFATSRAANTSRAAVGRAGNAMEEISRVVRMATPNPVSGSSAPDPAVVAGTATSLTVDSLVDTTPSAPVPTQVAFSITSGALQEQRIAAAPAGSYSVFTGATTTRTVASGLTSVTFDYLDRTGAVVTPDPVSGLSAAQRGSVASITVTVTAPNSSGGTSDPVVVSGTILLTNVALSNRSGT